MGLFEFVGGVFFIIFGLILLWLTIPTFLVGLFVLKLSQTVIITITEAVVGIIMFASGIYIVIQQLVYLIKGEKKETKPQTKTEPKLSQPTPKWLWILYVIVFTFVLCAFFGAWIVFLIVTIICLIAILLLPVKK